MYKKILPLLLCVATLIANTGCSSTNEPSAAAINDSETSNPVLQETSDTETVDILTELDLNSESKEASEYTIQVNSAIYSLLDFEDSFDEIDTENLEDFIACAAIFPFPILMSVLTTITCFI